MTFWIIASALLFLITMLSAFGNYFGLYGKEEGFSQSDEKYLVVEGEKPNEHTMG
ncbi:hypothetical protein M3182_04595 [Mesobacillus maritimus]|uniref:hypothetical protein n=1 Tax=Mesobacillus maritimus TaxID=1643336 RepID=UPI00203E9C17|nr:hypothetical protein [Mesobacillus maritimus]MCM3585024.1 hypothetical protein [Mesobacillus maritimus]